MKKVTHLRAFTVKYLAPINTRGSRIKITDKRNNQSVVIPYNYELDTVLDIAIDYLVKRGFNVEHYGDIGDRYVVLCDNWGGDFINLK